MAEESARTGDMAELIALVHRGQALEESYRADVSQAERERVGTLESWAPKETLAHFAYWKTIQAKRLTELAAHGQLPSSPEWARVNDETWPEHARLRWDEAVARSDAATDALLAALRALPADILGDVQTPESRGERVVVTTLGNSYAHIVEHVGVYYINQAQPERATHMQRDYVEALATSGFGPAQEAFARYNLGCFYATHGQPAEALAEMTQALPLRPDLVASAKDDHDLDSLRGEPAFQALLAREV